MHFTTPQLETHLAGILDAPKDQGAIEMIIRRPDHGEREQLTTAELDPSVGVVGDNWGSRPGTTPDGSPDPLDQLTLMNSRAAQAVAGSKDRWALAGDQIYVDMNLSHTNLPAGTQLSIGSAVIEISAKPHTGCSQFTERFGAEALRFVNVGDGKLNRLRGVNASVVTPGTVTVGDRITKL